MRGTKLADLIHSASPEAFTVAESLTAAERTGLVEEVVGWLGGVKQASRLPLLAWIDESAWPELIAKARAATDARRAKGVLEEAARQVPSLVGRPPPTPARHLAFERGYVEWRSPHPTQFTPPPDAPLIAFGGATTEKCGLCHQPLHRLLELHGLELATCLSCVGWEQPHGDYALSYRHDVDGVAHSLVSVETPLVPQFPNPPLRPTLVALVDAGPRFWSQDWGAARGANLHRAGGAPTWIQSDDIRECPDCKSPMEVILQLDSELPQTDGRRFAFGSGGILYVQACTACQVSTHLWQCT